MPAKSKRKPESPVDFHKRTGKTPPDYAKQFGGRYYCDPALEYRHWPTKEGRDAWEARVGGQNVNAAD